MTQQSRHPARQLPTHPCPRCGFPVPAGQRFCPNCGLPQPPRYANWLIVVLALLALIVILSLLFGWAAPGRDRPPAQTSPIRGIARTATPVPPSASPTPLPSSNEDQMPAGGGRAPHPGLAWFYPGNYNHEAEIGYRSRRVGEGETRWMIYNW